MDNDGQMNRRSFLKVVGVTTAGAATTVCGLWGRAALGEDSAPPVDLTLRGQVRADELVPAAGDTPYLEVLSVRLHPHARKTRFMIALRFKARDVRGARLHLKLLDAKGTLLGEAIRVVEVGPETWVSPMSAGVRAGRKWNDARAIWLDLAKKARAATQFDLTVEAVR